MKLLALRLESVGRLVMIKNKFNIGQTVWYVSCCSDAGFICCHTIGCSQVTSIRDNTNRQDTFLWHGQDAIRDEDMVYGVGSNGALMGESEMFESSSEAYGFMLGHLKRKQKQHIDKINAMHNIVVENSKIILGLSKESIFIQEKDGIFRDRSNG